MFGGAMAQITTDFRINGAVDFVDVHVERDNLLYIDPSAIRRAARVGDGYGVEADQSLTEFFDGTLLLLRSTKKVDQAKGETDLQHFRELGSTRLGMSRLGFDGHGAAKELGTRIWDELFHNPLCAHAIGTLKYVEDIPLFVDGIDKDVTSDITARIVLGTLARFTADQMLKHPQFARVRPTTTLETEWWNQSLGKWEDQIFTLPSAEAKPLLLVPKWFVNYKIQMTYGQYYDVPLLDYIKWEDTVEVKRGKRTLVKPRYTKKQLKTFPRFSRNRSTSIDETARIFRDEGVDVLGGYRSSRQTSFEPLSDDLLDTYLSKSPKFNIDKTGRPMAGLSPRSSIV